MFVGHFGIGLGGKSVAPKLSLGTLFLAAQLVDLLWPVLLLLDIEHAEIAPGITVLTPLDFVDYPISHSLLMVVMWGILFGLIYWLLKKNIKAAIILGLCVVSHWVLDLIVHRPDLPLYPGSSIEMGFGLWNSLAGTLLVEGFIYISGIVLYLKTTKAKNKVGKFGFWGLIVFLTFVYLANFFGPPPTDMVKVAWVGNLQWIIIGWAYWIDRNRTVR